MFLYNLLDFFNIISKRTAKVASVIEKSVKPLILQFEKDHGFITITHVEVFRNLSEARIFIKSEFSKESLVFKLNKMSGFLKIKIFDKLTQKRTPKLVFVRDIELEEKEKIEEILSN